MASRKGKHKSKGKQTVPKAPHKMIAPAILFLDEEEEAADRQAFLAKMTALEQAQEIASVAHPLDILGDCV